MERHSINACALIMAQLVAISSATAQDDKAASSEARSSQVDQDIVVTARRREESLQSTPVAVTALSPSTLARRGVDDVAAVADLAPNVIFATPVTSPNDANIGIRGQFQRDSNIGIDPTAPVYQDGIYIARSSGALLNLTDVQRVEVLRGPQGTLFGRNTTGGAVNIVSVKPTDEFNGSVKLQSGTYSLLDVTGIINVPLTEGVAARIVAQKVRHDGYGYNSLLSGDIADEHTTFIKSSLLARPADNLTILLQGDFTERHNSGQVNVVLAAQNGNIGQALVNYCGNTLSPNYALCAVNRPGDRLTNYVDVDPFRHEQDTPSFAKLKAGGGAATITWDLSGITIKSISAYRRAKARKRQDQDGTPYSLIDSSQETSQSQYSTELQLFGNGFDDKLQWITGGFLFRERGTDNFLNRTLYPLSVVASGADSIGINKSAAVYGQVNYTLADGWRITAGGRYTRDQRNMSTVVYRQNTLTGVTSCALNLADPGVLDRILPGTLATGRCAISSKASFDYISYTFGTDYQITRNVFAYAKTDRGYRSGGFNTRPSDSQSLAPFNPERVTSYEVGFKATAFDRRVVLNAALFSTKYDNIQRTIVYTAFGAPTSTVVNAAAGTIKGLEVEAEVVPVRGLHFQGALGLLDTKYDEYINPRTGQDLSDSPFTRAPSVTVSGEARYETELQGGSASIAVNYSWRSAQFHDVAITSRQPAYGLLGASVIFELEDPHLTFSFWGRNLTNTIYINGALDTFNALGVSSGFLGEPRTLGASVRWAF